MNFSIRQTIFRDELKKKIFDGFGAHAIEATGINGLAEEPHSFEIFNKNDFVGAIVVQLFWGQLHIKYLFVDKAYRGQGIAHALMEHALKFGIDQGCHFAFVETMSFQAPKFYQELGFHLEFSRPGYAQGTTFHYLKKPLISQSSTQLTRYGVYGICLKDSKLLLVRQERGPYGGKYDFPGGGIEFGESPEQTLRRELLEEVAMECDSMQLITNIAVTSEHPTYTFFHIGMLYKIDNCRFLSNGLAAELQHFWIDLKDLCAAHCSPLLWKYSRTYLAV